MLITWNERDITDNLEVTQLKVALGINDQANNTSFTLTDVGCALPLQNYDPITILADEEQNLNPAHNLLLAPTLPSNDTAKYFSNNGSSAPINFNPNGNTNGYQVSCSNSTVGIAFICQNTQRFLVYPGVKYMFSIYENIATGFSGASAVMKMDFLDNSSSVIAGAGVADYHTSTFGTVRVSVSATAPSNAVAIQVCFGVQVNSTTNSGSVTYYTAQLEPMTFTTGRQYRLTYPTPDCNVTQANCYQLPDGTTVRQNRVFSGRIHKTVATYNGYVSRDWQVECAHLDDILDTTFVNKTYSNMYDSDIIADIITTYFSYYISGGISLRLISTINTIQGKLISDSVTFKDRTVKEVLNELSDNAGFIWFLDNYADLHFCPQSYAQASWAIVTDPGIADGITTFYVAEWQFTSDFMIKGNRTKVTGGKYYSPFITEPFNGNASTTTFYLQNQPVIVQTVSVGGTSQKCGVNGVTTLGSGGYTAVYDKASKFVQFSTAPASGTNNISITYSYETNVEVLEEDQSSVMMYGRAFDRKVDDSTLITSYTASQRAIAENNDNAYPRNSIQFNTRNYLGIGSNILVTSPKDDVYNTPFTVQSVDAALLGNNIAVYTVVAGSFSPDLVDFLKHMRKTQIQSDASAGQPLVLSNVQLSGAGIQVGCALTIH